MYRYNVLKVYIDFNDLIQFETETYLNYRGNCNIDETMCARSWILDPSEGSIIHIIQEQEIRLNSLCRFGLSS